MDLREKLSKRIADPKTLESTISIIEKYNLEVNIRNFDRSGISFKDLKKRKVRVLSGEWRNRMVHITKPDAEIIILYIDGILSGWISKDKIEDLGDRFTLDVKSLNPMPEIFSFDEQCPHMEIYGGFFLEDTWECAGCEQRLVFNES